MLGTSLYDFLSVFNFVKAVILISKHATLIKQSCLSSESALTHAEMDFWASKIDLKIQEHLVASSHEDSVEQFTHFIMATDIGLFILTSVKTISYQAFTSIVSFFHWKECKEKSIGLKRFKTSLKLPCKSIDHSKEGTVDSGLSGLEVV